MRIGRCKERVRGILACSTEILKKPEFVVPLK
jgi:hypothetical protein